MISQTAEYSLRAVVCLAEMRGRPHTTQEIAALTNIPVCYLSKVLQYLHRAGIVSAQRGLNGGFLLQRDPASLTILEIVQITDPGRRSGVCRLPSHVTAMCAIHQLLDEATAVTERVLAATTIADLAGGGCQARRARR